MEIRKRGSRWSLEEDNELEAIPGKHEESVGKSPGYDTAREDVKEQGTQFPGSWIVELEEARSPRLVQTNNGPAFVDCHEVGVRVLGQNTKTGVA